MRHFPQIPVGFLFVWLQQVYPTGISKQVLKYFYPKAVQYYLPAYLKFLLLQPDQVHSMTRISLLHVLTPDSSDWKAKNLRVKVPFTTKQKEVIRIFFEGYAELFPFDIGQDELRDLLHRAIEYWQYVGK